MTNRDDEQRRSALDEGTGDSASPKESEEGFSFPSWNQPLRAHWDPAAQAPPRTTARRSEREGIRRQSRLGRFVSQYGWRAYAIPVLLLLTILVIVEAARGGDNPVAANGDPGLGTRTTQVNGIVGAPQGDGQFDVSIPAVALPAGGPFTERGNGSFRIVPGASAQVGQGLDHVYTYTVDVENGVDTVGYGGDAAFAQMVDETLANPKSWIKDAKVGFVRVDRPDADFHIALTSQMTVRDNCGYDIPVETSCFNADLKRVVLNEPRWVRGAVAYQGDIGSYRQYMVNHEVGHAIGYAQHQACESPNGLAPVMMQQTFGTTNAALFKLDTNGVVEDNGLACTPNPWPYPRA